MQGNLVAAHKLLSWHSEIATAISTREADGRSVSLALSSDAISRTQCDTLFDLLRSHPFADLGNTDVNTNNSTGSAANLVQEFTAWQARVRKFRQSKVAILTMIPELDTVLRILLGDLSTLEHHCELPAGAQAVGWETGWGWAKQATALLLYVHPPPLNKGDLYRVIEECMRKESKIGFADNSL